MDALLSKLKIEWRPKGRGESVADVTGNGKAVSGQLKERKEGRGKYRVKPSPSCVSFGSEKPATYRPLFLFDLNIDIWQI